MVLDSEKVCHSCTCTHANVCFRNTLLCMSCCVYYAVALDISFSLHTHTHTHSHIYNVLLYRYTHKHTNMVQDELDNVLDLLRIQLVRSSLMALKREYPKKRKVFWQIPVPLWWKMMQDLLLSCQHSKQPSLDPSLIHQQSTQISDTVLIDSDTL